MSYDKYPKEMKEAVVSRIRSGEETLSDTNRETGITPSESRAKVSNDNPYTESLFKTLKYVSDFKLWGFETLTEARFWVKQFVE